MILTLLAFEASLDLLERRTEVWIYADKGRKIKDY